jgi:hypothetical protein
LGTHPGSRWSPAGLTRSRVSGPFVSGRSRTRTWDLFLIRGIRRVLWVRSGPRCPCLTGTTGAERDSVGRVIRPISGLTAASSLKRVRPTGAGGWRERRPGSCAGILQTNRWSTACPGLADFAVGIAYRRVLGPEPPSRLSGSWHLTGQNPPKPRRIQVVACPRW